MFGSLPLKFFLDPPMHTCIYDLAIQSLWETAKILTYTLSSHAAVTNAYIHSKKFGVHSTPKLACQHRPNWHTIYGVLPTPSFGVPDTLNLVCCAHPMACTAHHIWCELHSKYAWCATQSTNHACMHYF